MLGQLKADDMKTETRRHQQREDYKGRSVERMEDERILKANSEFIDDIEYPDMLHARIFRSPYAHAMIESVDASEVLEVDKVVDANTGTEAISIADRYGTRHSDLSIPDQSALASEGRLDRFADIFRRVFQIPAHDRFVGDDRNQAGLEFAAADETLCQPSPQVSIDRRAREVSLGSRRRHIVGQEGEIRVGL